MCWSIAPCYAHRARSSPRAWRSCRLQAHAAAGGSFNVDSPKQLQEILFGKLGLPVVRKTPTGQPSTAEDVLEELAAVVRAAEIDPRIPRRVQAQIHLHRQAAGTDQRAHRPHPYVLSTDGGGDRPACPPPIRTCRTFRSARPRGAASARRSSPRKAIRSSPRIIRRSSCASWRICRAMRACSRRSPRTATYTRRPPRRSSDCRLGEVSADQRRSAKAVNFGLIYGMSAFGLARQLGISRGDAQRYVDLYFQRYPGVKRYMDETRAQARELGYVETVFGRRLYLPEIRSRNAALRQYAERSAINAPMQGTAADIIKRAMIEVDAWLGDVAGPRAHHHAGARRTRARGGRRCGGKHRNVA